MTEMSLAPSFDLEKLLTPISAEHPAGESLRYAGTYDRIQEARWEDDPVLPQGVWQTELKKADWHGVQEMCLEALETRSKDLHLAVWLLEAWLHLYGFAGVKEGLQLIHGLCERFWDTLYPALEDTDAEARIAPITWANEKLSLQLKHIPLTHPQTGDLHSYCWADWESACYLDNVAKREPHTLPLPETEGKVTQAQFLESVMLSPTALYGSLTKELQGAIEATTTLASLLDTLCQHASPSLCHFKETLMTVHRFVRDILRDREHEVTEETYAFTEDTTLGSTAEAEETTSGYVSSGGPIRSRAEAYRRLSEAAEYLLRTEPHSPTPYLVKRAVSWGGKSLAELLQEIVRNDQDLLEIYALLGVMKEGGVQ
jgi:type VI secretion system ImpA family protein